MIAPRAVPVLPANDLSETCAYYKRLGFEQLGPDYATYLLMLRGFWELQFFRHVENDPLGNVAGAYLRTDDVDAIDVEWAALDIPHRDNGRLVRAEDKDWGMREMALIDLNGNLLRVGQPLP